MNESIKRQTQKMDDDLKARDQPYKTDPKTGRSILHPPPGMSNEEFARKIGEGIENLPPMKGLTKERRTELAEKWKANTELKPVTLDPPRKASRGYGMFWLYIGVALTIGTVSVIALRFRRKY